MYGSNGRRSGPKHGPTSSLILQQHLVNHYRHLRNVRPAIDTGQVTRTKRAGHRSLRQMRLQRRSLALGSDSTASLQLIDRILNDVHCPPQYYIHQIVDPSHSEQCSETTEDVPELHAPTSASSLQLPNDDDCILKKIDTYLSAVRQEEQRQAVRRRFNLSSTTSGSVVGRRSIADHSVVERSSLGDRPAHRSPLAGRQSAPPGAAAVRRSPARKRLPAASAADGTRQGPGVTRAAPRPKKMLRPSPRSPKKHQRLTGAAAASRPRLCPAAPTSGRARQAAEVGEVPQPPQPTRYLGHFSDDETEIDEPVLGSRVPPLPMSPRSDTEQWPADPRTSTHANAAAETEHQTGRPASKDSAYQADFSGSSRAVTPVEAADDALFHSARCRPPPPAQRTGLSTFRCCGEQPYVQFLNEVTSDILARGVFTNRIVRQVMAAHVERHRGLLDMERMQLELAQLREELGVPAADDAEEREYGYGFCLPITPCTHTGRTAASSCIGGHLPAGPSTLNLNAPSQSFTARSRNLTVRSRDSNPPVSVPAFVDSVLFPSGGECRLPRPDAGGGDTAPPAATVAPPHGAPENVTRLLRELSLDDSITRTILRCYGAEPSGGDDTSINSEELHECLSGDAVPAEAS